MSLSRCITHKAISTPLAAAVASAAAGASVAAVEAQVAAAAEVVAGATAAVTTTPDLMRFRLRNFNFFKLYFSLHLRNYIQKF